MRGMVAVGVAVAMAAAPARADDAADDVTEQVDAPGPVQIHAFLSQGFLKTTRNNYLAETRHGSFEFTEAGINFTSQIDDSLRVGVQLFARDLGPIGDYRTKLDWAYLDYRWRDWLGLRAGRVKLPFGLYNDVSDVDAAHPGALLPQSVYPTSNRDFLLAQTGVELYGYRDFGRFGALDYRAYGGTIFLEATAQRGSPFEVLRLTIPYVAGGRVLWELPVEGLRLGASVQKLRLETTLLPTSGMNPMPVDVDIPALLWVGSVEYAVDDVQFVGEYSRWHVKAESSDPMAFPDSSTTSERTYGLITYRAHPWLQAGGYYSIYRPDVRKHDGPQARLHDAAALVRFDINPYFIVKVEGHYMRGTAGLSASLNDGTPPGSLANTWTLLAAKATAYF